MNLQEIQKGRVERPARMLLCGVEKIGKSTFAAHAPKPVFIPIRGEEGVDDLDVPRFPVAGSYAEVLSAFESLYSEKHDFRTVVLDSASTLEPLIWDAVCKEHGVDSVEKVLGGFGKGYVEAVNKWRELMAALDALREKGLGCILIGHVVVRTFTDPTTDSYDQYQLDLQRHAASALIRWSDCILFANCKTIVRKEDANFSKQSRKAILREERVLYTQKRPAHPGGGRGVYGRLPYELPLEWETFEKAIQQAKGN